jgi:hypothetical protein
MLSRRRAPIRCITGAMTRFWRSGVDARRSATGVIATTAYRVPGPHKTRQRVTDRRFAVIVRCRDASVRKRTETAATDIAQMSQLRKLSRLVSHFLSITCSRRSRPPHPASLMEKQNVPASDLETARPRTRGPSLRGIVVSGTAIFAASRHNHDYSATEKLLQFGAAEGFGGTGRGRIDPALELLDGEHVVASRFPDLDLELRSRPSPSIQPSRLRCAKPRAAAS